MSSTPLTQMPPNQQPGQQTGGRLPLRSRPRRNRKSAVVRNLVRETSLDAGHLIYPLFIQDSSEDQAIDAMPGCTRWGLAGDGSGLLSEVEKALKLGIGAVVLFPAIEADKKTPMGDEALNPDGLVPRAIRGLKERFPELTVITDVALDPYSSDGHDGIVSGDGRVLNDQSVAVLREQALNHAYAGADIISPSDMMDGRVVAIRAALDGEGFTDVSVLSYTAKYASALYGPFRSALDSAPKSGGGGHIPGDKKTYQMDPANAREALREAALDEAEGADMLMIKPAMAYLDVIYRIRQATTLPVAAYHVSGEYLMIKAAAAAGYADEKQVALESLLAIRRAGADMILTYFAPQAAQWLKEEA